MSLTKERERLERAIDEEDMEALDTITNNWRFRDGLKYGDIARRFKDWCGIDAIEFDEIMGALDDTRDDIQ